MAHKGESSEPQREREELPEHAEGIDRPAAPVERISPDEAAYLKDIWAKRTLMDASAKFAAGVMDAYFQYLAGKYALAQDDRIDEDGAITRVVPPAVGAE